MTSFLFGDSPQARDIIALVPLRDEGSCRGFLGALVDSEQHGVDVLSDARGWLWTTSPQEEDTLLSYRLEAELTTARKHWATGVSDAGPAALLILRTLPARQEEKLGMHIDADWLRFLADVSGQITIAEYVTDDSSPSAYVDEDDDNEYSTYVYLRATSYSVSGPELCDLLGMHADVVASAGDPIRRRTVSDAPPRVRQFSSVEFLPGVPEHSPIGVQLSALWDKVGDLLMSRREPVPAGISLELQIVNFLPIGTPQYIHISPEWVQALANAGAQIDSDEYLL